MTMNEHDTDLQLTCAPAQAKPDRKSGRVAFDNDGRSVWEWQTATGVFTRNVTEDQLTTLSSVELKIDETPEDVTNAKVFTGSRRPVSTTATSPSSRRSARTKSSVAAWLRRGWLG
jgi:hypothetical protein